MFVDELPDMPRIHGYHVFQWCPKTQIYQDWDVQEEMEIPGICLQPQSTRVWNNQAQSNCSWSNDRGPYGVDLHLRWQNHLPPHLTVGPNNPPPNQHQPPGHSHGGPPFTVGSGQRAMETRTRGLFLSSRKRDHVEPENVPLSKYQQPGGIYGTTIMPSGLTRVNLHGWLTWRLHIANPPSEDPLGVTLRRRIRSTVGRLRSELRADGSLS